MAVAAAQMHLNPKLEAVRAAAAEITKEPILDEKAERKRLKKEKKTSEKD